MLVLNYVYVLICITRNNTTHILFQRNERREREQREFIKARLKEERLQEELNQMFESKSMHSNVDNHLAPKQNVVNAIFNLFLLT